MIRLFLLRTALWVGLPLLLAVLAIGPGRVWGAAKRAWRWLWQKKDDPETILTQVVRQHQAHVAAVRKALAQAEAAEADILRNLRASEQNVAALEAEAQALANRSDDLGARATLYKLNLERVAVTTFQEQHERLRRHVDETRRRLYLLELQLRQYEVGRSILLSQLAEANTVEQQYAIANQFDPFSAVANWQRAEGIVEEKALLARAAERVHTDTTDFSVAGKPAPIDAALLDAELARLKAQLDAGKRSQGERQHAEPGESDVHNEVLKRKRVQEG
jgi:phage shock protein A